MRLNLKFIIALLFLTGCGKHKDIPAAMTPDQILTAKYERYQSLMPDLESHYENNDDGLLFTALASAGYQRPVAIDRWHDDSGQWYRRPDHLVSKAISRDPFLGLFWYTWVHKQVQLADSIYSFGAKDGFVMDKRDPGKSLLLPDEQQTLALVEHRLDGDEHAIWKLSTACLGSLEGFENHLQSLVIGVRALMGSADTVNEHCINAMRDRQPENPWFQVLAGLYSGDQTKAVEMLNADTYCPNDHLPTSDNRCEEWLWQREVTPKDWEPCPDRKETYSGGDCALAMAVALGKFRS